jgi:hypothetical protein
MAAYFPSCPHSFSEKLRPSEVAKKIFETEILKITEREKRRGGYFWNI